MNSGVGEGRTPWCPGDKVRGFRIQLRRWGADRRLEAHLAVVGRKVRGFCLRDSSWPRGQARRRSHRLDGGVDPRLVSTAGVLAIGRLVLRSPYWQRSGVGRGVGEVHAGSGWQGTGTPHCGRSKAWRRRPPGIPAVALLGRHLGVKGLI